MLATAREDAQEEAAQRLRTPRGGGGRFFAGNWLVFVLAHRLPPFAPAGWQALPAGCGASSDRALHVALPAQVGEPIVEQFVDLLLEQDFLKARRYLIERRTASPGGIAAAVCRGSRFICWERFECLAEALLNKAQNLQAIAEIGFDALRREPVRSQNAFHPASERSSGDADGIPIGSHAGAH